MIRPLAVVVVAAAVVAPASAARPTVAAHVAELTPDGFVVAFETDEAAAAVVEVARGPGAFAAAGESRGVAHRVRVRGLQPGERVRWRATAAGVVLGEGRGQAAPADDANALDLLVYGDTRDGERDEAAIAVAGLSGAPVLAVHTGDLVPSGDDDEAWRRFFDVEQALVAEVPVHLAVGNHDLYRDPEGRRLRRYLPPPGGVATAYYTLRVGPARLIVLDSNHPDVAQTAWLAETLTAAASEAGRPHVLVFLHHPPFSTGGHCGSGGEQAAWVALFERHHPSAVFAGHDHAYERLERRGVRYFVTGGGGAPLYDERPTCSADDRVARRVYRAEHHLLRVRVRGEALEVEAARPSLPPIEIVRWARGDPTGPDAPAPLEARRAAGPLMPWVAVAAAAAGLAASAWWTRRRARRRAG